MSFPRGSSPQLAPADRVLLFQLPFAPHSPGRWMEAFQAAGDGTSHPRMPMIQALRRAIWVQTASAVEALMAGAAPPLGCPDVQLAPIDRPFVQVFAHDALPPVACPPEVAVLPRDVLFAAERARVRPGTVAVLCMCSASRPGGGVTSGRGAQEESLHRRSDLCRFSMAHGDLYPIEADTLLYARNVTVLRGPEEDGYPFLDRPYRIDVILCPALRSPELVHLACGVPTYAHLADYDSMFRRILLILKSAADHQVDTLILSAFGCGAYRNPPDAVALLFAHALARVPRSALPLVLFAILDDHYAGGAHCPSGNFLPFRALLHPRAPSSPPPAGPSGSLLDSRP